LTAIDSKTKFVLAEIVVVERTLEACIEFLQQIKRWCYSQMLETYKHESKKPAKKRRLIVFVSDKFVNYKTSWKKLFYRITILRFGVPIACKKFGLKHNNNSVERHNRVECTPKSGQIDNEVQLPGGEEKVHYDKAKVQSGIQAQCASRA